LNDAAEKRPFTPRPHLLSQEVALPRNGRLPWLTGPFPARETKAALGQAWVLDEVTEPTAERVAYPAGLEAESA
jgi:hypothetical protein